MTLALLAVSGDEMVAALMRGGFRLVRTDAEAVIVADAHRDVRVPITDAIHEAELVRILRAANLSYSAFLELLDIESVRELGDEDDHPYAGRRRRHFAAAQRSEAPTYRATLTND